MNMTAAAELTTYTAEVTGVKNGRRTYVQRRYQMTAEQFARTEWNFRAATADCPALARIHHHHQDPRLDHPDTHSELVVQDTLKRTVLR